MPPRVDPTDFVQVDVWPYRTLASRSWDRLDSAAAASVKDSVLVALTARGGTGVRCQDEAAAARLLVDHEWRFGPERVRVWAGYDTMYTAPRWRVLVLGYPSDGPACSDGRLRRALTLAELRAVARRWLYDVIGL